MNNKFNEYKDSLRIFLDVYYKDIKDETYKKQLENFVSLDFEELKSNDTYKKIEIPEWFKKKYNPEYDCINYIEPMPRKSEDVHEDNIYLARLIYMLLFGDTLPNLNDIHKSFEAGDDKYGGDTLNKIDSSYYLTIGNFMVLPKGKVTVENNTGKATYTLNQYRGPFSGFNDDLYKFINIIKKLYNNKTDIENKIWQELFKNNKDYFDTFKRSNPKDPFQQFIETNFLEGWEKLKDKNPEVIENFIKERGQKICNILLEKLS